MTLYRSPCKSVGFVTTHYFRCRLGAGGTRLGGLNPYVQIPGVMWFEEAHLTPSVETGAPIMKHICLSFGMVLKREAVAVSVDHPCCNFYNFPQKIPMYEDTMHLH
jgi:hypothetical protein